MSDGTDATKGRAMPETFGQANIDAGLTVPFALHRRSPEARLDVLRAAVWAYLDVEKPVTIRVDTSSNQTDTVRLRDAYATLLLTLGPRP